jgi:hypothetical protein
MKLAAVTLAGVLLLASGAAWGQQPDKPCLADAHKLCPTAVGGAKMLACLKTHESELSPECKLRLDASHDKARNIHAACDTDAKKVCPGMEAGTGLMRCLHQHQAALSPSCQTEIAAHPAAGH